jgi:hypothetical protein
MKQLKLYISLLSTKTVLTVLTVQGVITMPVSWRKFGPFIQKSPINGPKNGPRNGGEVMTPGEAVMELTRLGFRFRLEGEAVKVRFEGEHTPDPEAVSPLLDIVRRHKADVHFFLKCYCPRCGCCCFAPHYEGRPLCMGCDWATLVELYPDLKVRN